MSRTHNRPLRLTQRHVDLVNRDIPDPGPQLIEGYRAATDEDYNENFAAILKARPPGPFWLFGYGSLIWRPETTYSEIRKAVARGWHRRFCLGWDYRYRGNREQPGLMMALDRGGQCQGVVYRIPESELDTELPKLIRREMSMVPSAFPWRWIDTVTADGPVRALTFAMNRKSSRYIAGLTQDQLVDVLTTACGFRGSMVEYLFETVTMLEQLGIHDRNLWSLQEKVADRLDGTHAAKYAPPLANRTTTK